jgi:hypothetical protein
VSSNPLGNGFHNSVSTWTSPSTEYRSPSGAAHGQRLFDDITAFYSWYVASWCLSTNEPSSSESAKKNDLARKVLSLIKRIAEVSMNGGYFLSEKEEIKAVNELSDILQDLNSGRLRKQALPTALVQLMGDLTNANPKAKVVWQTTELEYLLCINPSPGQSAAMTEQYRGTLSLIIQKINPEMRDINASAISQGLSQILENPDAITDFNSAISEAIKHWL